MKKYKLTDETIEFNGIKLFRIEAIKDFSFIRKGFKGGFVQSEDNLSQDGNCWIFDNAKVYENAYVYGDAYVCGNACVFGNSCVHGNAYVYNNAIVHDNAEVCDNANICNSAEVCGNTEVHGKVKIGGDAIIRDNTDYIVFKNWWSSGRYLTWTRSNNKWKVGCFYGTGEELVAKAYKDSELSGREYKRLVDYVESILQDEKGGEK